MGAVCRKEKQTICVFYQFDDPILFCFSNSKSSAPARRKLPSLQMARSKSCYPIFVPSAGRSKNAISSSAISTVFSRLSRGEWSRRSVLRFSPKKQIEGSVYTETQRWILYWFVYSRGAAAAGAAGGLRFLRRHSRYVLLPDGGDDGAVVPYLIYYNMIYFDTFFTSTKYKMPLPTHLWYVPHFWIETGRDGQTIFCPSDLTKNAAPTYSKALETQRDVDRCGRKSRPFLTLSSSLKNSVKVLEQTLGKVCESKKFWSISSPGQTAASACAIQCV